MSHVRGHLVTGGTGFVGRALVLELLAASTVEVACLVRPGSAGEDTRPEEPTERLRRALTDAAAAYGASERVRAAIASRCRAVVADLDRPPHGLDADLAGRVEQVWHCAASLRYHERDRDALERTNVGGTERMVRLAAAVGASAFHYVSTAYVVGAADGHLPERRWRAVDANNVYEETKLRAEELVLAAPAGLRVTVLRPSVVVGHSVTSAVSGGLTGLYGLGRQLAGYAAGARPGGPVRFGLDPADTVDLVPVDRVARELVHCGLYGADRTVYHLTGGRPVPVGTVVAAMCRAVGLPAPVFVADRAELRDAERRLDRRLGFYATYMRGDKRFARANTDALLRAPTPAGVDEAMLDRLCAWYASRSPADASRKPPSRTTPADAVRKPPSGSTPADAVRKPPSRTTPADGPRKAPSKAVPSRVVMVGGGYTSLHAYRALRRRIGGAVRVTVVAPGGTHRFHGWTGEVLSGVLDPASQRTAFTEIWPDLEVIDGAVTGVDLATRVVTVSSADGSTTALGYEHLVLGPGSADSDAVPGLRENALSPKKPDELARLRDHLRALAAGTVTSRGPIVVVGGGLAGVEVCAAVAEWLGHGGVRVVLVHSGAELLPELRPRFARLARYAHDQLVGYGVEVRTGTRVDKVLDSGVVLADGTMLSAQLVVAALGQRPVLIPGTEPLARTADGRIRTDGHLRVPGHPGVWAGGDAAAVPHAVTGEICPPNALWAIKQGTFIGRNIARALRGRPPLRFGYLGLGRAGSLGVGKGMLHLYGVPLTGRVAWLLRAVLFLRFVPSRRKALATARELLRRAVWRRAVSRPGG